MCTPWIQPLSTTTPSNDARWPQVSHQSDPGVNTSRSHPSTSIGWKEVTFRGHARVNSSLSQQIFTNHGLAWSVTPSNRYVIDTLGELHHIHVLLIQYCRYFAFKYKKCKACIYSKMLIFGGIEKLYYGSVMFICLPVCL